MEREAQSSIHSSRYQVMMEKQPFFGSEGGLEGDLKRSGCSVIVSAAGSITFQTFASMAGSPVILGAHGILRRWDAS